MLTVEDFPCPVIQTNINGVKCWKYSGCDLDECIAFARVVQAAGEKFYDPLLDEVRSAHIAKLNKGMVLLLAAMDHQHRYNDYETMAYPNDFPVISSKAARGFTTNYSYLVHFNLLSKTSRNGEVHYWVTDLGRRFIKGESIRCTLYNIGSEVVGFDDISWGTINKYFSEKVLTEMRKPLWWVKEETRLSILTPEELAQE